MSSISMAENFATGFEQHWVVGAPGGTKMEDQDLHPDHRRRSGERLCAGMAAHWIPLVYNSGHIQHMSTNKASRFEH